MSEQKDLTALVISTDGTHKVVTIDRASVLPTLQATVGGYIEAVHGWTVPGYGMPDVTFFLNDEGKILNQPVNTQATALWWVLDPAARGHDHLCGVVVVTGGADGNGDTLSVPRKVIDMVEQVGG